MSNSLIGGSEWCKTEDATYCLMILLIKLLNSKHADKFRCYEYANKWVKHVNCRGCNICGTVNET